MKNRNKGNRGKTKHNRISDGRKKPLENLAGKGGKPTPFPAKKLSVRDKTILSDYFILKFPYSRLEVSDSVEHGIAIQNVTLCGYDKDGNVLGTIVYANRELTRYHVTKYHIDLFKKVYRESAGILDFYWTLEERLNNPDNNSFTSKLLPSEHFVFKALFSTDKYHICELLTSKQESYLAQIKIEKELTIRLDKAK